MSDPAKQVAEQTADIQTPQIHNATPPEDRGSEFQTSASAEDPQALSNDATGEQPVSLPPQIECAEPTEQGQLARRQASGPRTELGKQRASRNAIKHGVFSRAVALKGESHAEYELLVKGLWESLKPVGRLEEILVEKLATILWRHRRLITAEAAEIRNDSEFLEWDQRNQQQREAEEVASSSVLEYNGGLKRKTQNPVVLRQCLKLLTQLREGIERHGFQPKRDSAILQKIYGEQEEDLLGGTLYDHYAICVGVSQISEKEGQPKAHPTPEECRQSFLYELNAEIRRFERYRKACNSIEADRMKLERLRRSIPHSLGLDHLLRYEAHLSREFDRTLNQLEREQRTRLDQPVSPPVKVELST